MRLPANATLLAEKEPIVQMSRDEQAQTTLVTHIMTFKIRQKVRCADLAQHDAFSLHQRSKHQMSKTEDVGMEEIWIPGIDWEPDKARLDGETRVHGGMRHCISNAIVMSVPEYLDCALFNKFLVVVAWDMTY